MASNYCNMYDKYTEHVRVWCDLAPCGFHPLAGSAPRHFPLVHYDAVGGNIDKEWILASQDGRQSRLSLAL